MSVSPSVQKSIWKSVTGRILMKLYNWVLPKNLSRQFGYHHNLTIITGTIEENVFTSMISLRILLRTRNVSKFVEYIKTHFHITSILRQSCYLWVMKRNITDSDGSHLTICDAEDMRFSCRIIRTEYRTHTLIICNTATMFTVMYLNAVFIRRFTALFIKCLH